MGSWRQALLVVVGVPAAVSVELRAQGDRPWVIIDSFSYNFDVARVWELNESTYLLHHVAVRTPTGAYDTLDFALATTPAWNSDRSLLLVTLFHRLPRYVPGYRFAVGRFRFTGFSLRPEAIATFASSGIERPVFCADATISAATIRLRCDDPQVGIVTIEGKFLTQLATDRLDTPVVSAVVTVRTRSGDILYSAPDSFVWAPGR